MTDILTSPRFRLAVEVLLGLLLLVQGVRLALMLSAPPSMPVDLPAAAVVDPTVLARFDPFFRGDAPSSTAEGEPEGWTLHGVRAGGGGFDTAIISGADGRQAVYRIGEAVGPGVILDSVGQDHVTLSRGGALTRLAFPDAAASSQVVSTTPPAASGATPAGVTISAAGFVGDAALQPRLIDQRISGFVIQPRGRAETLAAAGLRAGDVITAINGVPMTSAERVADLESDLNGGETADIQYERGGRTHTVTLRIAPQSRE